MILYKHVSAMHKVMVCDVCKTSVDLTMGGNRIVKGGRDYCSVKCLSVDFPDERARNEHMGCKWDGAFCMHPQISGNPDQQPCVMGPCPYYEQAQQGREGANGTRPEQM